MSQDNLIEEIVQGLASNKWSELLSACFERGVCQNAVLNYMADRNPISLIEASLDFESAAPSEISEALQFDSLFSSQTPQNSVPNTTPGDGLEDFFDNDNDNDNDNNLLSNFLSDDFLSASTNQQSNQQNSVSEFLSEDDIHMYFGGESECTCVFWPEMSKQPTCDHCDFVAIRKEREEENKRKKIAEKKIEIQNFASSMFARPVRLQFFFDDE